MKDSEKSRETLIKELSELRQRVKWLESKTPERENKKDRFPTDSASQPMSIEQVWRLPGYWH